MARKTSASVLLVVAFIMVACKYCDGAEPPSLSFDWYLQCRLDDHEVRDSEFRGVTSIDVDSSGTVVVTGDPDGVVRVCDLETGRTISTCRGHEGAVSCVRFFGTRLLTAGNDATVRLWDIASGSQLSVLQQKYRPFWTLLEVVPEQRLALCRNLTEMRLVSLADDHLKSVIEFDDPEHIPYMADISPDHEWLATVTDTRMRLWRLSTRKLVHEFAIMEHAESVCPECAFSPDSKKIALWRPRDVEIWSVATQTLLGDWHAKRIADLSCDRSPDSRRLAVAEIIDPKGVCRELDATTGRELHTLQAIAGERFSIAYSPDGKWLASAGRKDVAIWDAKSGKRAALLTDGYDHGANMFAAQGREMLFCEPTARFTHDGTYLINTALPPRVWRVPPALE